MDMFPTANTSELSADDAFPKAGQPQNSNVRVFRVVVEILVVLLGVPGNLLIIRVYWRKTVKTSTIVLIQGLALADCIVCSVKIIDVVEQLVGMQQAITITQKIASGSAMASVAITSVIGIGSLRLHMPSASTVLYPQTGTNSGRDFIYLRGLDVRS